MASAPILEVTPKQAIKELQSGLGLRDEDLLGALGISPRTLQRWRAGTAYPQQEARQKIARLLQLQERVKDTFEGEDAASRWAHAGSRYLGGITPAEAIRVGRIDRAEAALGAFLAGIYL